MHRVSANVRRAAAAAVLAVLCAAQLPGSTARAGQMTPPAPPTDAGSAMWTLQDLYDQATTGTRNAKRTGGFADRSSISPTGTMRSLNELMGVLPVLDTANGAGAADVCRYGTTAESGKGFWGLLAPPEWGAKTGTRDCTAPTIGAIGAQSMGEDDAAKVVNLTLSDNVTAAASLAVVATSSDQAVLPASGISYAAATQRLTLAPATSGSSTVTVRATDAAGLASTATFTLTVAKVNHAPTASTIPDQATAVNVATSVIPFTVGDDYTTAASLVVAVFSSSDTAIVPTANVVLGGSGAARTVKVTPAVDKFTAAGVPVRITLRVSDGDTPALHTDVVFDLTVTRPVVAADKSYTSGAARPSVGVQKTVADASADCSPSSGATLAIGSAPGKGSAVLNGAGTQVLYTAGSTGSDSFSFLCVNGHGAYGAATISTDNQ